MSAMMINLQDYAISGPAHTSCTLAWENLTLPSTGNLQAIGWNQPSPNVSYALENGDAIGFTCPQGDRLLFDDNVLPDGSNVFQFVCPIPNDSHRQRFGLPLRCVRDEGFTPFATPEPTTAPSAPPSTSPTPSSYDCSVAYTELASNGVVGYHTPKVDANDGVFVLPLTLENTSQSVGELEFAYSLAPSETGVFTCGNEDHTLHYQGKPIQPYSTLNVFLWTCPTFNQNLEAIELPLSCRDTRASGRRALRGGSPAPALN